MNTVKLLLLIVLLGAFVDAASMAPKLPRTPKSRCQSPLSPVSGALSPVSPYSRSTFVVPVVPAVRVVPAVPAVRVVPAVRMVMSPVSLSKQQREEAMRLLDQKCDEMHNAEHARFMSGGDALIDEFFKKTLLQVAELRAQLS